jgi:fermentation-respiration switch protein FrsA (DUF1100 family)
LSVVNRNIDQLLVVNPQMTLRRTLVFTVVSTVAIFVLGVLWAGDRLTKPAQQSTGVPDPDLHVLSLKFDSASGTMLSAWFVPGSSGAGALLLLHSVRSNKRAMLPRAKFLRALGFSVLLVDLQAHGESEGERISFGYREAADVRASVAKLQELAPGERIGVLGTSLGGAALLLSDVQPLLAAVVLESLYPTIEEAVANRLRIHFGAPGPWLSPLLLSQLGPRLGITPTQLRPIQRVALLRCPVLVVHGSEDRHTTMQEAERLFAAVPPPKEFYSLSGAGHVDLHAFGGKDYERRVGEFLGRHLRTAG